MDERISFRTAQNVEITLDLASVGDRITAFIVDLVFILAYMGFIFLVWRLLNLDSEKWILFMLYAPVPFYHLVFEIFNEGQSPGKKLQAIRVVQLDGTSPGLSSYLLRWIFRSVDIAIMSGVVALFTIAASNRRQRVGDAVADTTVVRLKQKIKLSDTVYESVESGHSVQFQRIDLLSDSDVQIIKAVLRDRSDQKAALLHKTANKIAEVLQIERPGNVLEFLSLVIKDYNAFNNIDD